MVLIAVYLPPRMPENKQYRDTVRRCMEWVRDILRGLPGRCLPILLGDFNDQLGMRADAQAGLVETSSHGLGHFGRREEHYAAGLLRDLMQTFDLTAIDTLYLIGPTYFGERHGSNIDHVCIPTSATSCIDKFLVPWRSQRRVQAFRTRGVRDHVPLLLDLRWELRYQAKVRSTRIDRDKLMKGWMTGYKRDDYLRELEHAIDDRRDEFDSCATHYTPDAHWGHLVAAMKQALGAVYKQDDGKSDEYRGLASQRRELLQHRAQLREQLREATEDEVDTVQLELTLMGRRCKRLRQRQWRDTSKYYEDMLYESWRFRDFANLHRYRRLLVCNGRGPRKRQYWSARANQPTSEEWMDYLSREPGRGGMAATQEYDNAEHYTEHYLQQREEEDDELLPLDMHIVEQARADCAGMARYLRRMKKRRAHPHWTVPAEGLLIAMLPRRVLRPERTTGIGMVQDYMAPKFEKRLMDMLIFVRRSGWLPLAWHRSAKSSRRPWLGMEDITCELPRSYSGHIGRRERCRRS